MTSSREPPEASPLGRGTDHSFLSVIQGKVEDVVLPDGITQVDIIVSEWMGYALLYESMLDSVLRARDRFLKPEGVMAPSESKIMLALCDGNDIYKERVGFWSDVYGTYQQRTPSSGAVHSSLDRV